MKRIFSVIMSVCMILPMFSFNITQVNAASAAESGIISLLNDLEIMQGDGNGDMGLERAVSRAEFAKIAIAASPAKNSVAVGLKVSPYKDVPHTKWYAPYIRAAVTAGYVAGYLDATYRPDNTVTYEEAITVMLRILNYADNEFGAAYPYGQIAKAKGLDMLDNVNANIGDALTRRQVMNLVYNTLQASSNPSAQGGGFSGSLLSAHDCTEIENADVIATANEDSSLGGDKVFTSSGTYTKGDYFNSECVGMTGTVFVKNSRDIVAFVPDSGNSSSAYEEYFVYSNLQSAVVGYRNGSFETIDIPDSATVYRNQSPTSYSAIKSSLEMGDTLYVKKTSGGSIDYITYDSGSMTGPLKVVTNSWLSGLGATSSTTVMKDGVKSSASAVLANDIVYYSKNLDMVFAYSDKVTGVYESASPSKDSPSSVTISGVTYDIEGVDAFNNLSSSGSFNYGDTVTICLGKGGDVAGVVTSAASVSSNIVGYVTNAGRKIFTDSAGGERSSYYVTLVTPDGVESTYETSADRSSSVGTVCRLSIKNGLATISRLSSGGALSGKVSYANMSIGNRDISDNVNILDVANDNAYDAVLYKKIFMQRIDGITLTSSQVLYYEENASGEVVSIILNNVTGDVYSYGTANTSTENGQYTIDINGTTSVYNSSIQKKYRGPCKFIISGNSLKGIISLGKYGGVVSNLTHTTAVIGNTGYKLSDSVVCYKKTLSSTYQKISIDEAINGEYSIKAYYDKVETNGGRIRILVCNYY